MRAIAVSNRRIVFPCLRISRKQRKMNFFSQVSLYKKFFREMDEEKEEEDVKRKGNESFRQRKFLHGKLCALSS